MEEHATVVGLQRSRARLRALLLGGTGAMPEADVFPRSALMRFMFDPARRGIAMVALGALVRAIRR